MTAPASAMYSTIQRTPADLRDILARGADGIAHGAAMLSGEGRLFCVGTGTSYHAAINAAYHFQAAGLDTRAWTSFDFATYTPALHHGDAIILFAHTGTTGYSAQSLAAANAADVPSVVVCSLEAAVDGATLLLRTVVPETSAAYSSSHTAAMFYTGRLAAAVARRRGNPAPADADFGVLPGLVEEALTREPEVEAFVAHALNRQTYCAGAGPDSALALEASLKARETAYLSIDSLPTEQFIHGPMVVINSDDAAILVATEGAGRARTRELLTILDGIGLRTWIIGSLPDVPGSATTFALPDLHPFLAPVLAVIPIQLFACFAAHQKGTDADSFRGDVPEYGRAWADLKF